MKEKIKPLPPEKVKVSKWEQVKRCCLGVISVILALILFLAALHILVFYIFRILNYGLYDETTIKYSIYLVIGTYFFLILDRRKIYETLGIRQDLKYIPPEKRD